MKTKKIVKFFVSIFVPLVLIVAGLAFYHWQHYSNKNNLLEKYVVDNTKEVYVLGTIGKKHFNRINNYSMEDMISAIENINPDTVAIIAREDNRLNYSIVDGDIAACVAYSYCLNKNIPTEMIDWWIIDNIYPESSTSPLRDDNIFIRLSRTINDSKQNSKILVVLDSNKFYEQTARFKVSGFKEEHLEKNQKKAYFASNEEEFVFPPLSSKTWKNRSYFYAYVLPRLLIENEELFDSVKENFLEADHDKFYREQIKYCKYLNNNILYR